MSKRSGLWVMIVAVTLAYTPSLMADASKAGPEAAAADVIVTGQHRGFTNDKLYLRLDDEKELTLVVNIPGDKDQNWHKEFETLSRVTVTYHKTADGKLVATSIKKTEAPKK